MKWKLYSILIQILFVPFLNVAQDAYVEVRPEIGEGSITLLNRFELHCDDCTMHSFCELNKLTSDASLFRHRKYKLPIKVYDYNGKSIRSTIGINNWDLATDIAAFNKRLNEKDLKNHRYQDDKRLWVPLHYLECDHNKAKAKLASSTKTIHFPAFGKKHSTFELIDNSLSDKVYYLVSGHGGPDPGATCKTQYNTLCEDEYAYDVVLRLAKNLIARGAEVEVVIQDPDDGIRSEAYLECDNDEVCVGGKRLPLNQLKRLQQRADVINNKYIRNRRESKKEQYAVMIHVDSRSVNKNQDVYFYHLNNSRNGKKLAKSLYNTFKNKYAIHRESGQYHGSVSSRNLYMLRATYPPAVFIELGNLRNPHDQQRIFLEDNRQALADWIFEGLAGI